MVWDITGFDQTYQRPIFAAQIIYASGPSGAAGGLKVLLSGMKSSAGNLVADTELRRVYSRDDCNTAAGQGSQLARMGLAALKATAKFGGNVELWMCACAEPAGTQATVTMLLAGAQTSAGSMTVYIAGQAITTTIALGDSIATIGANVVAKINGTPDCPFTASFAVATITLTCINKGTQGTRWVVYQDLSNIPGLTSTITGSSSVNALGAVSGVFAGASATGTGTESIANTLALSAVTSQRWARIGVGQVDATNAALWLAFLNAQAAPTVQIYDHAIFANNGTQSAATTISQTTLNLPRAQVYAQRNGETHPAEVAAGWAAVRAAVEGVDVVGAPGGAPTPASAPVPAVGPVPDYDHFDCSAWVAPSRFASDIWIPQEENALLNAGATPISTVNGATQCVRGIGTYCLLNAVQDTRCLDIGDSVCPDYIVLDLQALYATGFRQANPYVQDDPAATDPVPPAGMGYPKLWTMTMIKRFTDYLRAGIIQQTFLPPNPSLPLNSTYNKSARRIQSNAPFVVTRVQHQLSVIARQSAPS